MKKQFILIIAAVGCLLTASYAAADNHPVDDIYATEKTPTLTKEQKKAEKARKKREKEIKDSISFELAKKAVEEGRFVITADQIRGKHGRTVNVNRTTNFVLVQGDTAVVQFALEGIVNSPNGIGGLTVEGRVTKKRIDYDKRGNLNYTMYVTGTALSADVTFTLPKGSTRCSATVNSNFSSDQLTFYGELCPRTCIKDGLSNNACLKTKAQNQRVRQIPQKEALPEDIIILSDKNNYPKHRLCLTK